MARSATSIPVWILLLGPGLLALCAWAWVGRGPGARFWAGSSASPYGPNALKDLMLGVVPGLALVLSSIDIGVLVGDSPAILLAALMFVLGGIVMVFGGLGLRPRWWGPAWYRRKQRPERDADHGWH